MDSLLTDIFYGQAKGWGEREKNIQKDYEKNGEKF